MDQKAKALKLLEIYQQTLEKDEHKYFLAMCQIQLENYPEAQKLFEQSSIAMLQTKRWMNTSEPNVLVDICILSGITDFYPAALSELEPYKQDYRGNSLIALYAYAIMELLVPSQQDITGWIQGLLKYPKYKDAFAMGQTLEAILSQDQVAFDSALASLLKAHEGMAKYGSLRDAPTGLFCMPAMSLAYVALTYNLKVEIVNDYFSTGYLEYITT